MANGVTTQWFDIHVKMGNYLPLEQKSTLLQDQQAYQESVRQAEQAREITQEEAEDQDDQFLREYQAKRREELIRLAGRPHFGKVVQVTYNQYVKEVTQASENVFVVLNMYQNHVQASVKFNSFMDEAAQVMPHVKFVKIIATKCVEGFPDEGCPCLIIYYKKQPIAKLAGASRLLAKLEYKQFEGLLLIHGVPLKDIEK